MLDADTKRRIDTARDILVGKVPDPKSQVEQITIALIYKFMDDLDAESEEWGGERTFFAGEFARYGWAKLMQPGIGGHEMLNLYAEAITRMPENPGIPPLFRDIFNNAFLPYRDPETLRAFLKIINEFTYDHSERLGDAFEYLLSVLGSQGDAGQFRTPRHIIDFIVAIVDPKKDEVVLDPACGTAGFLISAYKHILAANSNSDGESTLTPDDRGRLVNNFRGYDISPDMVRLSLVNMYLHGFREPHIHEYDTLTSEERWNEYADVVLANPPFMSPKGGIRPHNRFSIQSKRSEVLFVDYIAEHLTANGRAGIIVPEGIIFQSQRTYTALRKKLVEESLVGVISLPSGVFQPYTGVKTSILILDKVLAKRNPHVFFSNISQIGLSLGVRRIPIEENDLPQTLIDFRAYSEGHALSQQSLLATRENILANNCILTASRYRMPSTVSHHRVVSLGAVCKITKGLFSSTKTEPGPYPLILTAAQQKSSSEYQFDRPAVCVPLISSTGHGKATLHRIHFGSGRFALADLLVALHPNREDELDVRFLYHALDVRRSQIATLMQGAANVSMKPEDLAQFQIPLPPLSVQREIVEEIEVKQKAIDAARDLIKNLERERRYSTHAIGRLEDVEWVRLGHEGLFQIVNGGTPDSRVKEYWGGGVPWITLADLPADDLITEITSTARTISKVGLANSSATMIPAGSVVVSSRATIGRIGINRIPLATNQGFKSVVIDDPSKALSEYVALALTALVPAMQALASGSTYKEIIKSRFSELRIPLPPLDVQREIIEEDERQQALVNANCEMIRRFEQKIQVAISRVWGDEASAS